MTEARWFVRSAAVLVALANLAVLAHLFGGSPALPTGISWGAVSVGEALPYVLAAAVAGIVASEVALRRFDRLSAFERFVFFEKLSPLNAGIVGTVCLGGALMGVLLSGVLVLRISEVVWTLPLAGFYAALIGGVLGAVEGLLLAPPLAALLRSSNERPTPEVEA